MYIRQEIICYLILVMASSEQGKFMGITYLNPQDLQFTSRSEPSHLMEPGYAGEFKRATPVTRKDAVEGDVPVATRGRKPACFHNTPDRESGATAVAGLGVHAGSADCRTMPVRQSGFLSIHASGSMLQQRHLHCFLRRRRRHIHHLNKGAGSWGRSSLNIILTKWIVKPCRCKYVIPKFINSKMLLVHSLNCSKNLPQFQTSNKN